MVTRPASRGRARGRAAWWLWVALLVGFPTPGGRGAFAQGAGVTAKADTNAILIGGQVRVSVSVEHPAGTVVRNIGPADSLDGIEIVRVDSVEGSGPAGPGPFARVYTITSFDTGTRVIPPFTAWYGSPSDTAVRSVTGQPLVIVVRGVDVDTSAPIKAIKPPLDAPISLAELLPYLIGAALAALLGWLAYYIVKKRKRGETIIPAAPERPADEIALEALRSIEAERLWQRGLVKEYHSALSDVLRTYIERRCRMPAMESTSDEILSSPAVSALDPGAVAALRDVLSRSDLAKFARFVPPPEQNERSFAASVSFVELTRRAALDRSAGAGAPGPVSAGPEPADAPPAESPERREGGQ